MRLLSLFVLLSVAASAQQQIRGFAKAGWKQQHDREEAARELPDPAKLKSYMERMSQEPHHAGSPGSKAVAEYALGLLKEWGLEAEIEEFEALLPYPTKRALEMISPVKRKFKLEEPAVKEDKDSQDKNQLPTYNAYSAAGDVTAPLVYVNYGLPEDYAHLKKLEIDVKGKIVIARYGKSWRGTKPKVAEENGAIGCLIFSDPRDDGYFAGDVYPKGPFRPAAGVQRGSVLDMPRIVGDPLSPGWASEKGSKRLELEEAVGLMKIPVLPISYEDAKPLLESLTGPVAPESWRGALPFTYHIGPGPSTVRLKLEFDMSTRPLYNVIATVPGSSFPDEWVMYGNHHDAWVNGAQDPVSGASVLLETARALAEIGRYGWKPKRTIKFALWDGEEFGLLGSTEWAEKYQDELGKKLVAYINSDSNGKGRLGAGGSSTLYEFLSEVLRDVEDPVSKESLIKLARARRAPGDAADKPGEFRLGALGAGSDYVAFIHHLGVASLNLGFSTDDPNGIYHSIYDSFHWYTAFSDKDFAYGRTLAQVMLSSLLRLADAPLLPFDFTQFVKTVSGYVSEVKVLKGAAAVDLSDLYTELDKLRASAAAYEGQVMKGGWHAATDEKLAPVNRVLFESERALLYAKGLPEREWYRYVISAPGMYTGYGAKTLPGVREAIEGSRPDEANAQVKIVAAALRAMNTRIVEASKLLAAVR